MTTRKPMPGRPKGSGNIEQTHGAKRAKEYWNLLAAGVKPSAAARQVAEKWHVAESTVFTDYKRHTMSNGQVEDNFAALHNLLHEHVQQLPGVLLAAIEEQTSLPPEERDADRIRSLMRMAVDQWLDQLADQAPNVTDPATIGGTFRRAIKKATTGKE